jgi:hypothetical protein
MPWLASLGAVLALAQPTAESTTEVGALPLRVSQDISAPDQSVLEQRFNEGLTRSGFSSRAVEASCEDAECYRGAGQQAGVPLLVSGTIEHEGPDYQVQVFAVDANTGEVVASVDGVCEICGVGELGDMVGNLAARLRPAVESSVQPTTLKVDTDPSGADVYVDGEMVGTTPLEVPVTAGPHEIEVVKRGRRTERVQADLRPGVKESFSFRLASTTRVPGWLPWAALGGGMASLAAGVGLLVIHENPIKRDCNADVEGNCEFLYDTVAGGAVLTVAGVALVGTGVGLFIVQARQDRRAPQDDAQARRRPPRRAATLRVVPGLGGASLIGRF